MNEIVRLDTISDYNKLVGIDTRHPLVSVIDFEKSQPLQLRQRIVGFYTIYLKEVKCGDIRYGCNYYDYEDGTMLFIAPGQVSGIENTGNYFQPQGYALLFHPDLIHGTTLGKEINHYSFFDYDVKEALHLSRAERDTIIECLKKIDSELDQKIDHHSKKLIATNIELLLDYCMRFYERQFITRENANKGLLERFETLFNNYYKTEKPLTIGFPSVAYFADELNLSANYFGDLIKKETGMTAREYIQFKLIDLAKERVFDESKTISEIAYELGFKYSQHFSRLFKQQVGYAPNEYRKLN